MIAPIVLVLVFLPLVVTLLRTVSDPGAWPLWVLAALAVAFTTFLFARIYRNNRGGLTRYAWAYALRAVGLMQAFGGAWVLATGRTPTRFGSHPVARGAAMNYFVLAVGMWLLAYALTLRGGHRRLNRPS